jgi:tRNA threonylcarbamoyl adenosine modification protein (Sua5/YciO/YrdC/YwlC family)
MTTDLDAAVEAIRSGQVVGMPTDTVYGLAVDPLTEEAVGRLFDIKGRPEHKPVGLLVSDLDQAESIGEIDGPAGDLARDHWPGALTLIVRPTVILADWVGDRQRRSVGLRVPDHPLAIEFLAMTGPLAVTSANRSGELEAMSSDDARAMFGEAVAVYLPGVSPGGQASTVVDVTGASPVVLRQGPVAV